MLRDAALAIVNTEKEQIRGLGKQFGTETQTRRSETLSGGGMQDFCTHTYLPKQRGVCACFGYKERLWYGEFQNCTLSLILILIAVVSLRTFLTHGSSEPA